MANGRVAAMSNWLLSFTINGQAEHAWAVMSDNYEARFGFQYRGESTLQNFRQNCPPGLGSSRGSVQAIGRAVNAAEICVIYQTHSGTNSAKCTN